MSRFEELAHMMEVLAKVGKTGSRPYKLAAEQLEKEARLALRTLNEERLAEKRIKKAGSAFMAAPRAETSVEQALAIVATAKEEVPPVKLTAQERELDEGGTSER